MGYRILEHFVANAERAGVDGLQLRAIGIPHCASDPDGIQPR